MSREVEGPVSESLRGFFCCFGCCQCPGDLIQSRVQYRLT